MGPELSVIMPVYNGGKYLKKMLESVVRQTFRDFELLVVDNRSTDSTPDVIREFEEKDDRIRGLFQEKQGVSAARNLALEECAGQFVMFLDGDDWIDDDYFEIFLSAMNDADLASAGYRAYFEKGVEGSLYYDCFYESPTDVDARYTPEQMLERLFEVQHYQGYVWNKCYRGEIIRQHHLRFHEDICYNEDRLFTVEYLSCCHGQIRMLGANKYHYILHAGNAVSAEIGEFPKEQEFTEIEAFSRMLPYLEKYPRALELAKHNMAERELLLFGRMIDPHGFARYRKSRFRSHARQFPKLQYRPKDEQEERLCKKLVRYGWTGICYGRKA